MSDWFRSFFTGMWADLQPGFFTAEETDRRAAMIERLLALRPASRVLDVPCGNGRLTVALGRRGHTLTGIDFTPAFVAAARAAAGDLPLTFLERDMRRLDDLSGFDAAFNYWGSFGYFGDADDEAFAASVCRTLVPGGRFLVEGNLTETLIPVFQPRGWSKVGDTTILEDRSFDLAASRIDVEWTFFRGGAEEQKHASFRLYSAHEITTLLGRAGFSSVRLLDFATEGPLTTSSRRALVVATR